MGLRLVKPAAWMSRMIGRMLPQIEPLASYGPRACARLAPAGSGVPSRFPCALGGCFGALRERLALVLSNGRQDVDAQLVGVRVIRRHELHGGTP
jgi:hypothetical protein